MSVRRLNLVNTFLKVRSRKCLFEIFSLRSSTTLLLVVILGFGNSVVCLFICLFVEVVYMFVEVVLLILFIHELTFLG